MIGIDKIIRFYKGSKRYFISSLGFPQEQRDNVTIIYNFCRFVDDSVDNKDKCEYSYEDIKNSFYEAFVHNKTSPISLVNDFVELAKKIDIRLEWVEGLFNSMDMDINQKKYLNIDDTYHYTYGAAEVVGLFMCQALQIHSDAYPYAMMLGRSAQWANFIRDLSEDLLNKRVYFPKSILDKYSIKSLDINNSQFDVNNYTQFIREEINRFFEFVKQGEQGFQYIPDNFLKPIVFATELDKWKMRKIYKNPTIIYYKKINPPTLLMIYYFIKIHLQNYSKKIKGIFKLS
jgi:15-cis-phytoene synthase